MMKRDDMAQPSQPLDPEPRAGASASSAQVVALGELAAPAANGAARAQARPVLTDVLNPLRNMKARLTVSLGVAEITIGELLEAREQQVLCLDRAVGEPLEVLLEGHVVARGVLVAVGERFGVRITEVAPGLDGPLRDARER